MSIKLSCAISKNNVIGKENKLPWKLSEDLKRFKELTTGNLIVMGRKTFDSIGRPLPNRKNIVLSNNLDLEIDGVEVFNSPDEVISLYKEIPEFKLQNYNMSMQEFKIIFWWEWAHRFLGRIIGIGFLFPLIYFYYYCCCYYFYYSYSYS